VKPDLEVRDLACMLDEQVFPELLAPVHLHRQAAEVAEQLFACLQDRLPLAPQGPRGRRAADDRAGRGLRRGVTVAALAAEPLRDETRHRSRI
jgi:hypothetical protein